MAKRFATTYSNGFTQETSNVNEAFNFMMMEETQKFFLKGVEVSYDDFYQECVQLRDAAYAKKCETHKKVVVLHGSSVASYVTKWVKK